MEDEIRLYDMNGDEWKKHNRQFGNRWRSSTIYRCAICHTKTNLWILGGTAFSIGPRLLCPGDRYEEHDELEETLDDYGDVSRRIQKMEELLKKAPELYQRRRDNILDGLYGQRGLYAGEISRLRKLFSGRCNNLKGVTANSPLEDFIPFARAVGPKKHLMETGER